MPPFVYVPTTGEADTTQRRVLMRELDDGRTALFVYSAMDRLERAWGAATSWVVLDVPGLQKVHDSEPYDLLFLDMLPKEEAGNAERGTGGD